MPPKRKNNSRGSSKRKRDEKEKEEVERPTKRGRGSKSNNNNNANNVLPLPSATFENDSFANSENCGPRPIARPGRKTLITQMKSYEPNECCCERNEEWRAKFETDTFDDIPEEPLYDQCQFCGLSDLLIGLAEEGFEREDNVDDNSADVEGMADEPRFLVHKDGGRVITEVKKDFEKGSVYLYLKVDEHVSDDLLKRLKDLLGLISWSYPVTIYDEDTEKKRQNGEEKGVSQEGGEMLWGSDGNKYRLSFVTGYSDNGEKGHFRRNQKCIPPTTLSTKFSLLLQLSSSSSSSSPPPLPSPPCSPSPFPSSHPATLYPQCTQKDDLQKYREFFLDEMESSKLRIQELGLSTATDEMEILKLKTAHARYMSELFSILSK